MDSQEFVMIRRYLHKTQKQIAKLLGVSPKAVQSFEQAWRSVPLHVERQLLFLLYLKRPPSGEVRPCWEQMDCSSAIREECVVWELQAGHLCWFINGTICGGRTQESWDKKMQLCRRCEVFRGLIPPLA